MDLVVESLHNRKVSPKIHGWKTFVREFKKAGGSSKMLGNSFQKRYMKGSGAPMPSLSGRIPKATLKCMLKASGPDTAKIWKTAAKKTTTKRMKFKWVEN